MSSSDKACSNVFIEYFGAYISEKYGVSIWEGISAKLDAAIGPLSDNPIQCLLPPGEKRDAYVTKTKASYRSRPNSRKSSSIGLEPPQGTAKKSTKGREGLSTKSLILAAFELDIDVVELLEDFGRFIPDFFAGREGNIGISFSFLRKERTNSLRGLITSAADLYTQFEYSLTCNCSKEFPEVYCVDEAEEESFLMGTESLESLRGADMVGGKKAAVAAHSQSGGGGESRNSPASFLEEDDRWGDDTQSRRNTGGSHNNCGDDEQQCWLLCYRSRNGRLLAPLLVGLVKRAAEKYFGICIYLERLHTQDENGSEYTVWRVQQLNEEGDATNMVVSCMYNSGMKDEYHNSLNALEANGISTAALPSMTATPRAMNNNSNMRLGGRAGSAVFSHRRRSSTLLTKSPSLSSTASVVGEKSGAYGDHISDLFPFYLSVDEDMNIVAVGSKLPELVHNIRIGRPAKEWFRMISPSPLDCHWSWAAISARKKAKDDSVFEFEVLQTKKQRVFNLHGPVYLRNQQQSSTLSSLSSGSNDCLIGTGSPQMKIPAKPLLIFLLQPKIQSLRHLVLHEIAVSDFKWNSSSSSSSSNFLEGSSAATAGAGVAGGGGKSDGSDSANALVVLSPAAEAAAAAAAAAVSNTSLSPLQSAKELRAHSPASLNQLQQSLEMKRMFVRYVSHEMRTPLNTVSIGLDLVRDTLSTILDDVRDCLASDRDDGEKLRTVEEIVLGRLQHEEMRRIGSNVSEIRNNGVLTNGTISTATATTTVDENSVAGLVDTIKEIGESTVVAVDLMNDLLLYEKIDGGLLQLEKNIELALKIVYEAVHPLGVQAKRSGLFLELSVDDNLFAANELEIPTVFIEADDVKLSQVLRNLVSNAIKFSSNYMSLIQHNSSISQQGRIVVSVSSVASDASPSGRNLRVDVVDSGPGISAENQKKLFSNIVQFDANKLQGGGGSGLGLYISKGIMDLHNGTIGVYSDGEGKGSRFFIELPTVEHHPSLSIKNAGNGEDKEAAHHKRIANSNMVGLERSRERSLPPADLESWLMGIPADAIDFHAIGVVTGISFADWQQLSPSAHMKITYKKRSTNTDTTGETGNADKGLPQSPLKQLITDVNFSGEIPPQIPRVSASTTTVSNEQEGAQHPVRHSPNPNPSSSAWTPYPQRTPHGPQDDRTQAVPSNGDTSSNTNPQRQSRQNRFTTNQRSFSAGDVPQMLEQEISFFNRIGLEEGAEAVAMAASSSDPSSRASFKNSPWSTSMPLSSPPSVPAAEMEATVDFDSPAPRDINRRGYSYGDTRAARARGGRGGTRTSTDENGNRGGGQREKANSSSAISHVHVGARRGLEESLQACVSEGDSTRPAAVLGGPFFARSNAHQVYPADYPSPPSTTPQSAIVPGAYKRSSLSLKRDSSRSNWIGAAIFRIFKRLPTIPSSQSP